MGNFITFPKPEATTGKPVYPLVDKFKPEVWNKYKDANLKIGVKVEEVSVMQFVMRTLGDSNRFSVIAAKNRAMQAEVYVKHYNHVFSYNGAFDPSTGKGFALDELVNPYVKPRYFFAIRGDHARAESIRGPTNGAAAREIGNKKFAPFTIRGIYGIGPTEPMFHMTAETQVRTMGNEVITLDAEEMGKLEIVRFIGAGSVKEKLDNWPLVRGEDGLYKVPTCTIDIGSIKIHEKRLEALGEKAWKIIGKLMNDYPEVTHGDISAFFGEKARPYFNSIGIDMPEPARLILPSWEEIK